jgi:hypothetical protein
LLRTRSEIGLERVAAVRRLVLRVGEDRVRAAIEYGDERRVLRLRAGVGAAHLGLVVGARAPNMDDRRELVGVEEHSNARTLRDVEPVQHIRALALIA